MNFNVILQGISKEFSLTMDERKIIKNLEKEFHPWVKTLSCKEKFLLRKYTYNSHEDKPDKFFKRLNQTMRGEYNGSDKEKLLYYGNIISNAICKHELQHSLICYRCVDEDVLEGISIGTVFKFNQFLSTSVVKSGTLKKKYQYVIIAPKGTKGAFIQEISVYKGQFEFLLDKDCKYKLVDKTSKMAMLEVIV